jgi:hypothetical protein
MKKQALCMMLVLTTVVVSCNMGQKRTPSLASPGTMIDSMAGSCTYLTKDDKGKVVLSWVRQLDSVTSIVCYAISRDGGESFGRTTEVPGSTNVHPHGENMPKLVFKPSGEIIAAWGAANPNPHNKYSGLVFYCQSFDEGKTWTKPVTVTTDSSSYDQRYFDLALLPGGEAGVVWLDNRKRGDNEGSGLYYAVTKGKTGFRDERLISGPCCQCCRTDLFVDRADNIHVLYRAIINDSIRDMVYIVSTDNGGSFTPPKRISQDGWVISGCPHTGPAMTENNEGLHFTWFTGGGRPGIYYNSSKDDGNSFGAKDFVSGRAAKHCQITALPNDNLVIAWEESFQNDNGFGSRIAIEEKDPRGNTLQRAYITPADSNSSFPAIYPINSTQVIIAYTEAANHKDEVRYKILSLAK